LHRVDRQTKLVLGRSILNRQTTATATTAAQRSAGRPLLELNFNIPTIRVYISIVAQIAVQVSIQLRVFAQYLVVVVIQIHLVIRAEFDHNIAARLRQIVGRALLIRRRIARAHLFVQHVRIGG
jgi:hypothetical protein